jgi:MinD superfamily P-loop ATPase
MSTLINPGICICCGVCITECPHGAIEDDFTVTQSKCDDCSKCVEVCLPAHSLTVPDALSVKEYAAMDQCSVTRKGAEVFMERDLRTW